MNKENNKNVYRMYVYKGVIEDNAFSSVKYKIVNLEDKALTAYNPKTEDTLEFVDTDYAGTFEYSTIETPCGQNNLLCNINQHHLISPDLDISQKNLPEKLVNNGVDLNINIDCVPLFENLPYNLQSATWFCNKDNEILKDFIIKASRMIVEARHNTPALQEGYLILSDSEYNKGNLTNDNENLIFTDENKKEIFKKPLTDVESFTEAEDEYISAEVKSLMASKKDIFGEKPKLMEIKCKEYDKSMIYYFFSKDGVDSLVGRMEGIRENKLLQSIRGQVEKGNLDSLEAKLLAQNIKKEMDAIQKTILNSDLKISEGAKDSKKEELINERINEICGTSENATKCKEQIKEQLTMMKGGNSQIANSSDNPYRNLVNKETEQDKINFLRAWSTLRKVVGSNVLKETDKIKEVAGGAEDSTTLRAMDLLNYGSDSDLFSQYLPVPKN